MAPIVLPDFEDGYDFGVCNDFGSDIVLSPSKVVHLHFSQNGMSFSNNVQAVFLRQKTVLPMDSGYVSMSTNKPDSQDFHICVIDAKTFVDRITSPGIGQLLKEKAMKVAEDLGVDIAALDAALEDEKLLDPVSVTYGLAQELGINGTPSYVVGNEAVYGAVGVTELLLKVKNIRQCGETSCS